MLDEEPAAEPVLPHWRDPASLEPLHVQVRRHIEHGLRSGAFPPHRALPSARHLCAVLGVSRTTVDAAFDELTALGLVVSKPRSGRYPAPTRIPPAAAAGPRSPGGRPDWGSHLLTRREAHLLEPTIEPDYTAFKYPFLPGQLEPRSFPSRAWLRSIAAALDGPHLAFSLRDSVDQDDPLLVQSICREILPPKGIVVDVDQVLVTNGAQQALSLISEVLLDRGRGVAFGDPGYVDAARIFARTGARLDLLPVDDDGIVPDFLGDVDLVYVTPSHHHPTNVTLHHSRREDLLERAALDDFLIVEDDFDSEVRFRGAPTLPMKSTDPEGRVVYVGTFSKFLAPGLRLGYVVADPMLIAELRDRRRYTTKHPAGHLQRSLALFIESGDFHRALRQHRVSLQRKWQTLDAALQEHLPWPVRQTSAGGLSFWVSGPEDFDASAMTVRARERGVLVSAGESYYLRPGAPRNSFRVGFNAIAQARIQPGVRLLAQAIADAPS